MKHWFALLLMGFVAAGAGAAGLEANRDYALVNPPLTTPAAKGKIDVVEYFSYGCPHCNDFAPLLDLWVKQLPKDVSFRRVPVTFNKPFASLARVYYALEMTGNLEKLDRKLFDAIHKDRINFNSDEAIIAWATKNGADGKKFGEALNAFSMPSLVQKGGQESSAAQISGVPALVIDGHYRVESSMSGNFETMLKHATTLIDKARQERKGK